MADQRVLSQSELMASPEGRRLKEATVQLNAVRKQLEAAEREQSAARKDVETIVKRMGGNIYAMGLGQYVILPDGKRTIVDPERVREVEDWARSNNQVEVADKVQGCFVESTYEGGLRYTPEENMKEIP